MAVWRIIGKIIRTTVMLISVVKVIETGTKTAVF